MGDPLDHGFNESEEPRDNRSNGMTEAGPSGTQWHEDDADARRNFDAMQLATVYEDEGMVREVSQILCVKHHLLNDTASLSTILRWAPSATAPLDAYRPTRGSYFTTCRTTST